uniref:Protein STRUBBELIG-RECEPTOR FAMILY 1 n=1 Tax=Aegilops tauschii TaxID=37682 RepID=M8C308_AEGTA
MAAPPRKRGLAFRTAALALLAILAVARGQQQRAGEGSFDVADGGARGGGVADRVRLRGSREGDVMFLGGAAYWKLVGLPRGDQRQRCGREASTRAGDVSGEVGILKRVNHSSLVRLSGFCVHHGDTYLVFEFAENGALSDWLHGGGATLVWKQRVQAAFDVADGLNYLHHYTNPPCMHKNLKSSNVLLDDDLRAKVSSFALARSVPMGADGGDAQLTRHVVGTQGYLAPEYLEHGLITPKLDVFAFGVILLELLSGKEATFDGGDKRGETLLWESAEGLVVDGEDARGKVRAFMDPRLSGDYPLDLAVTVASLAVRCVAREPRGRPSMDGVFVTLSAVYNSTLGWDPSDCGNSRSSIMGR